ncbi:hypothetical protein BMS3Bbin04_00251 [bacterium BMS3Bbin04]|nr:hypothetical protein BMS3Bbin04_00251 [bacterium BMS3Bbin04]
MHDDLKVMDHRFHVGIDILLIGQICFRHVGMIRTVRQVVHRLLDDLDTLIHLGHADHVSVVHVTSSTQRNIEIEIFVAAVWLGPSQIVIHPGSAQIRAGVAIFHRPFLSDRADVTCTLDEDAVTCQQEMEFFNRLRQWCQPVEHIFLEIRI